MRKIILALITFSSIVSATEFVCKGENISATIETHGDYGLKVTIDGKKYDGIWKGSGINKDGKPVKLHYLYGKENIWVESQNTFAYTEIRFHNDMDNMYIKQLKCKRKSSTFIGMDNLLHH